LPDFMKHSHWTLCQRCVNGQIITDRDGRAMVVCHGMYPPKEIHVVVATCTWFNEQNKMSKHDAEQIGWVLEVKGKKVMGFKPPKESK
jgi:hypothetical protein